MYVKVSLNRIKTLYRKSVFPYSRRIPKKDQKMSEKDNTLD